ncbi:SUKH-4 family immunity protein [Zavarzinella formosa]|uniref:SUKH-4 family immunity protein n=1 Tax=Zavarzinella formosa TaxID=360055 RepID=UPI000370E8E6|nr:SUKH-4 family immunity protein [Zavarzinella formosa]
MANPFEAARQWGGLLHPIVFAAPKPLLPASTISFLHYAGVPTRFEVTANQPIRFAFTASGQNLAGVWATRMPDWSLPAGWSRFWQIGDITYGQADAWLCIEELTGRVVAVDVDLDDPLYVVNGSVERLVRCMRVLYDWSRPGDGSLARVAALTAVLSQDPALPAGEAGQYWLPLVEEAVESGCGRLEVSCE